MYGGLHFDKSSTDALDLGDKTAAYAVANFAAKWDVFDHAPATGGVGAALQDPLEAGLLAVKEVGSSLVASTRFVGSSCTNSGCYRAVPADRADVRPGWEFNGSKGWLGAPRIS